MKSRTHSQTTGLLPLVPENSVDEHRDGFCLEREAGQVEDQLDRVLAAQHPQCDGGPEDPSEHQVIRRQHEHPDDERDLTQREGLRLAPEVDEDAPPLACREGRDEQHDGRRHRVAALMQWNDRDDVDDRGHGDEDPVEHPDACAPSSGRAVVGRPGSGVVSAKFGSHQIPVATVMQSR